MSCGNVSKDYLRIYYEDSLKCLDVLEETYPFRGRESVALLYFKSVEEYVSFLTNLSVYVSPTVSDLVEDFCNNGNFSSLARAKEIISSRKNKIKEAIDKKFIDSFNNNGICKPIDDIGVFYRFLVCSKHLNWWEISRLIGIAIHFNSEYFKQNATHNIKNIEVINKLAKFYNEDGSVVLNDSNAWQLISNLWSDIGCNGDCEEFVQLMNLLLGDEFLGTEPVIFSETLGEGVATPKEKQCNGNLFLSASWLLITGLENAIDDYYRKNHSDEKSTLDKAFDQWLRYMRKNGDVIVDSNTKIIVLEQVYHMRLEEILKMSGVPVSETYFERVLAYGERGGIMGDALCVLDDKEQETMTNFILFIAYNKDIDEVLSSGEYKDFVALMKKLVGSRIQEKKRIYVATFAEALEQSATNLPRYSYGGLFPAEEQRFINELNAIYNERTGEVIGLPENSIYEFLKRLMLMPISIYDDRKKKKIKTELMAGFSSILGKESVLWALDEKSRSIYLVAKNIKDALDNEKFSVVQDSDENLEISFADDRRIVVSLDECAVISECVTRLDDAYSNASMIDGFNEEDWDFLFNDVTTHIEELKELLKSKGIDFNLFAPKVKEKK